MPDMILYSKNNLCSNHTALLVRAIVLTGLLMLSGCAKDEPVALRAVQIQQQWQLQPGDQIVGHRVSGGLGDIAIELNGGKVRAPFDGEVEPHQSDCVIFSSPQVPAYLMRLCGVKRPRLGVVQAGEAIGSADHLFFAALRRQPDGKWAMVEPSRSVLERTVRQP